MAWSLVTMDFTLASSDSSHQIVPAFPFRIPCLLLSVQSWPECKRKVSVFKWYHWAICQLMAFSLPTLKELSGRWSSHNTKSNYDNRQLLCFLFFHLYQVRTGMLKKKPTNSLRCSVHLGGLYESFLEEFYLVSFFILKEQSYPIIIFINRSNFIEFRDIDQSLKVFLGW